MKLSLRIDKGQILMLDDDALCHKKSSNWKMDFNKFQVTPFSLFCPADFGESFIKNDPVQTLRNFSSSRVIGQR
jgi:hypothetical protein